METPTPFFIKYLPLKISLAAIENAELPAFLGSTIRGAIGQALYSDTAAFTYLYNNHTLDRSGKDVLNPYIIVPPLNDKTSYQIGEELNIDLILLGNAVQYAPSLIHALQSVQKLQLGALRYYFELKKITHGLNQRIIWQDGHLNKIALQSIILPYQTLSDVKQIIISLRTPLRIRRSGALLEAVDFLTIIRNIINRMEAIAKRYGGWVDKLEAERVLILASEVSIIQNQLEMKNIKRYSNRLGEKMDFSGLLGNVQFEGNLTPFVPWLYAAQILHIGRNTTFGMGKIEVEFI